MSDTNQDRRGAARTTFLSRRYFSLKTKITVLVVFLIVAILLSIGYLQIERDRKLREREMNRRAETIARTILSLNILGDRIPSNSEIQRTLSRFLEVHEVAQDIIFVAFIDGSARIMAGAVNMNLVSEFTSVRVEDGREIVERRPVETLGEELEFIDLLLGEQIEESNDNLMIVNTQVSFESDDDRYQADTSQLRSIVLGFSKQGLREEILQAFLINLGIFGAYTLIGILASVFLGGAISKPIKRLEEAMKRVSAGDLNQRVENPSRDEIGTLARTFNFMLEGLREKEKIKQEFLVAREVQFNLLPRSEPSHSRLQVATYFEPATEVGGDFYDYLELGEERLGIVIGDVSGHGMSAGLLMAITKSCLHTQLRYEEGLDSLMASVNDILFGLSERRSLVTLFYSIIDLSQLTIEFANAGHPFTYLIRGNEPDLSALEAVSYPLAVKRGLTFCAKKIKLEPGDFLVFYSDGIVEALDEEGNVFGYDRLESFLTSRIFANPQDLLEELIAEVRFHIGTAEQFDDITAVVLRIVEA